jgi:uncharacterized membrane protein
MYPAVVNKTAAPKSRVVALDIMRGIVMVIMSIDHASHRFNGAHFFGDSVFFFKSGTPIDTGQFFTRWITHLCAPTFVALAGTALAISTESRRDKGDTERSIDRHIAIRGLLLIGFEVVWMSWALLGEWDKVLFQVLYALGGSFLCMTLLRRLGDRLLLGIGIALAFGAELFLGAFAAAGVLSAAPVSLLFAGGMMLGGRLLVGYPVAEWLGMMCIGWVFGRRLIAWRKEGKDEALLGSRVLAVAGALCLALFVALRGRNGLGNMHLYREGTGLVQWLHVSKYPPSATYVGLELGLAALMLAGLMRLGSRAARVFAPVTVFGQTALFYYLVHAHLLLLATVVVGEGRFGIPSAYVGALAVLIVLYPACLWYRRYKAAHPTSWARWI